MKTIKKELEADLETIISGGKAEQETAVKTEKKKSGRPRSEAPKKQCMFYLPENLDQAIKENCRGNKSFFAEEVFRYYFDAHKIEY
jgi:hypothetical protein